MQLTLIVIVMHCTHLLTPVVLAQPYGCALRMEVNPCRLDTTDFRLPSVTWISTNNALLPCATITSYQFLGSLHTLIVYYWYSFHNATFPQPIRQETTGCQWRSKRNPTAKCVRGDRNGISEVGTCRLKSIVVVEHPGQKRRAERIQAQWYVRYSGSTAYLHRRSSLSDLK